MTLETFGNFEDLKDFEGRSGRLDRLLHDVAFHGVAAQRALADIEDRFYARRLAGIDIVRPVFVTALPRAGTTLLLEVLGAQRDLAAHSYRQMPFLLCPLLWDRLSRRFRRGAVPRERAHGDGLRVGYDSLEAFEEVLWRAFWPEKYRRDRIAPWRPDEIDADGEFADFFARHMRKLIALRAGEGRGPSRYLSKNNANIARLGLLRRLFPDAVVLVPFRHPLDQAASMLRQHARFLALHAADPFARRYMDAIGHFEFGAGLRPIDFAGWRDAAGDLSSEGLDFWLEYWCQAYEHVLAHASAGVYLLDYDACCAAPGPALARIAALVGLDEPEALVAQAGRFRPSVRRRGGPAAAAARARRAAAVHERRRAAAARGGSQCQMS